MATIGRYHVESELGRGAMGVVYLAADPRLERRVALKVYNLPDGLDETGRAEFRERFAREARAAARLSHPAIVTVYDTGEDSASGVPFIAMEHVDGRSLRELLAEQRNLPFEQAAEVATTLAEALQAAHGAGIVHRDVKPANVLVRQADDAVKIADFGVARVSNSTLTSMGSSIGSPAYMSPEQVRGTDVDGRSDLFSLGVILYEMLTGRRPFEGDDPAALAYAVAHTTPIPPSRLAKDLPPAVDRFFDRALAKDPAERFQDGAAFAAALREVPARPGVVRGEQTVVSPPPGAAGPRSWPRFTRRRVVTGAGLAALVWTAWAWLGPAAPATLRLDARNGFSEGRFTLYVDGAEVYARDLSAPRAKHGFLKKVLDRDLESFEAMIQVRPGRHEIEARITLDDDPSPYRETIVCDARSGETHTLKVSAGKTFGAPLALKIK